MKPIFIDGLQYSRWNRERFLELQAGGLAAVHVTIAYWEDTRETLQNLGRWNTLFLENADLIMRVHTVEDIRAAHAARKVGIIFGFQNCSPLEGDYTLVEIFQQLGVRFMQLSYNNQTQCAAGCYEAVDSGVTRFGKVVIGEMNRVGMVVDMSHSGDRSTLEAIAQSTRPITISHANPRSFEPALRNKTDEVLKALGESGGMLGFSLYPLHLKGGSDCKLDDFCAMVARSAEILSTDQIGIGTDLCVGQPDSILHWMRNGRWSRATDYGEGSAAAPTWPPQPDWFRDARAFPTLAQSLRDYGFSAEDVDKIMGLNWFNFMEKSFVPHT
jgi:microsomal dipeptidase-like Zn-dependent dipeptidase